MKMMMKRMIQRTSDKTKIKLAFSACVVGFCAMVFLSFLISDLTRSDGEGIFDGFFYTQPDPLTNIEVKALADQAYLDREPYPANTPYTIERLTRVSLSYGDFEELDQELQNLLETYRESDDMAFNYTAIIESYRLDLILAKNVRAMTSYDEETVLFRFHKFRNADVLASALLEAPISIQKEIFLRDDAVLIPVLTEEDRTDLNLTELEIPVASAYNLLANINLGRNPGQEFIGMKQFSFDYYDRTWLFTAVLDQDYFYIPYTIETLLEEEMPLSPLTPLQLDSWELVMTPAALDFYFQEFFPDSFVLTEEEMSIQAFSVDTLQDLLIAQAIEDGLILQIDGEYVFNFPEDESDLDDDSNEEMAEKQE